MGTGYTRQSAADIIPGAEVKAAPINAEFNQVRDAFDGSAGHAHDGSTGNGPKINLATSATGFTIGLFAGDGTNLQFRTLTGTANEIAITNGTGASGNPTVGLAATLALGGKAVTVQDNNFTVQNAADNTKKLMLSLTGITTGTTRTLIIPDANDTLAVLAAAQSLTNKKLGSLTTNGFVKTSAGDGTLSVDTNSYQPLDSDLTAIAALSGTGIAVQTAVGTWANRQLTAPAAGITVTNPLGLAGNITLVLANDLAALEALAGTNNIYYRSGVDTWTAVTIGGNLTFSGGTLNAVSGTSGTVTNTGGNLTANSVVLGAGTVDTKVVAGIITDGASKLTLGVAGGAVGAVAFNNATSGSITLQPLTGALGSSVLSLPIATDTLIGKATTDILTNKTFDTAGTGNVFKINGTTISSVTGAGAVNVMSDNPTFSSAGLPGATFTSTDAGAVAGPVLDLYRNSASPASSDVMGGLTFSGQNSTPAKLTYASIDARINGPTAGSEVGALIFKVANGGGTFVNILNLGATAAGTLSGGIVGLPLGQLSFPATQAASSDANTLDDYEEGTWTPTIVGTSVAGSGTYSVQNGNYIKIGRLVFIRCQVQWSAHTGTGNMQIAGLPFANEASSPIPFSLMYDNMTFSNIPVAIMLSSSSVIDLKTMATAAGSSALAIDTSAALFLSGTYETTA